MYSNTLGEASKPRTEGKVPDCGLAPSTISKLTDFHAMRRKMSLKRSTSVKDSAAAKDSTPVAVSHQPADVTTDSVSEASVGASSKSKTRYTISSRQTPEPQLTAAIELQSLNQLVTAASIAADKLYTETSYATPVAELAAHQGQTAQIKPPLIGDDLKSRLEGLKQFKIWSQRVHEESVKHSTALKQAKETLQQMGLPGPASGTSYNSVTVGHDLPLRHDSDIIDTSIDAPTPFSTPQVTPMPVHSASATQQTFLPSYSAFPPTLDLRSTGRSRAGSRTIVISSTPVEELEQQALFRSNSRSTSTSRSRTRTREKKHPPISFPKNFNERFADSLPGIQPTTAQPHKDGKQSTPSVSPKTKPALKGHDDVEEQEPLATPHDKHGRPVFYSTVHYYTECTHASPPATRPLDPAAQPRIDPDFHPTNPAVTRSIIPGMCFNCDTMYRRNKENDIVNAYTGQVAQLTHELADLIEQLELVETDSEDEDDDLNDRYSARLIAPHRFKEDKYDLRHQLSSSSLPPLSDDPEVGKMPARVAMTPQQKTIRNRIFTQIRSIESTIDKVRDEQDGVVKEAWKGYTRRWGPATLGIQRGQWSTNLERYQTKDDQKALLEHTRRSIEQRLAIPDEISRRDLDDDDRHIQVVGTMDDEDFKDGGKSTMSKEGSRITSREQLLSDSTSRAASRSTSRGRDGTTTPLTARTVTPSRSASSASHRDLPGARTPGEGKMRVGWIRE